MTQSIEKALEANMFVGSVMLDATDGAVEGTWTDFAGNSLTYTNWGPNQPTADPAKNLAYMTMAPYAASSHLKWFATSDMLRALVCQKKIAGKSLSGYA